MDFISTALVPILFVLFSGLILMDDGDDPEESSTTSDQDEQPNNNGDDILNGREGQDDQLDGGNGDDVLNVLGENTASGGAGEDIFNVDGTLNGLSTIIDFDPEEDKLNLTVPPTGGGLEVVADGDDLQLKAPGEDGKVYTTLKEVDSLEGATITLILPEGEDADDGTEGSSALTLSITDLAAGDLIALNFDATNGWEIDPGESGAAVEIATGAGEVTEPDDSNLTEISSGDILNATEEDDAYRLANFGEGSLPLIRGFDPEFDTLQIVLPDGGAGDLTISETVSGNILVSVDGLAAIQFDGTVTDLLDAVTTVAAGDEDTTTDNTTDDTAGDDTDSNLAAGDDSTAGETMAADEATDTAAAAVAAAAADAGVGTPSTGFIV